MQLRAHMYLHSQLARIQHVQLQVQISLAHHVPTLYCLGFQVASRGFRRFNTTTVQLQPQSSPISRSSRCPLLSRAFQLPSDSLVGPESLAVWFSSPVPSHNKAMSSTATTNKRVAIIGAGVCGLSTGVVLAESLASSRANHIEVTIIADKFSPDTTSDGAAGLWRPFFVEGSPERVK